MNIDILLESDASDSEVAAVKTVAREEGIHRFGSSNLVQQRPRRIPMGHLSFGTLWSLLLRILFNSWKRSWKRCIPGDSPIDF